MTVHPKRGLALTAILLLLAGAEPGAIAQSAAPAPAASPAAIAAYRHALAAYRTAHGAYEEAASAYWHEVTVKRHVRRRKLASHETIALDDYVLTQPPVYSGPREPINPAPPPPPPGPPSRPKEYVPVIADFLAAAKEEFGFVPRRPQSEIEYKQAYARAAADAGLTRDQVVRIYVFEVGGNGTYDIEAGLEYKKPGARAITTALGYNQLLSTNSVELVAEKGEKFAAALDIKAASLSGDDRAQMLDKVAILRRMIKVARTVPDKWLAHDAFGKTPQGLGIHAMLLDIDVGPLMQVQKLVDSVNFARRKGVTRTLTAAELEMMNFTGDGNGIDIVLMPASLREQVPTANFFLRKSYARNPVARRNNTIARLLSAMNSLMDKQSKFKGARELAAAYPK